MFPLKNRFKMCGHVSKHIQGRLHALENVKAEVFLKWLVRKQSPHCCWQDWGRWIWGFFLAALIAPETQSMWKRHAAPQLALIHRESVVSPSALCWSALTGTNSWPSKCRRVRRLTVMLNHCQRLRCLSLSHTLFSSLVNSAGVLAGQIHWLMIHV